MGGLGTTIWDMKILHCQILLLFLLAVPNCWLVPQAYCAVDDFNWAYTEGLSRAGLTRGLDGEGEAVNSVPIIRDDAGSARDSEFLDWVIMCESSNRHEGIWGQAGEYGILQYKKKSFYWLSEKYDFTGDWKNKEDQIALFLKVSPEDKYKHWSCVRKYYETH